MILTKKNEAEMNKYIDSILNSRKVEEPEEAELMKEIEMDQNKM